MRWSKWVELGINVNGLCPDCTVVSQNIVKRLYEMNQFFLYFLLLEIATSSIITAHDFYGNSPVAWSAHFV